MSVGNKVNVAIQGIGAVTFKEIGTNNITTTSTGASFSILDQPDIGRIPFSDGGITYQGRQFAKGRDPIMTVTKDSFASVEMAWSAYRVITSQTNAEVTIPYIVEPIKVNNNPPKNNPDDVFNYIEADADAIASVKRFHLSIPLTRSPFASFNPSDDDTFTVGDNGELRFAENLLNFSISMEIPVTLPQIRSLKEGVLPDYTVRASIVTTEGEQAVITIPRVSVSLENTGLSPFDTPREQQFQIIKVPGQCGAYSIQLLGKVQGC